MGQANGGLSSGDEIIALGVGIGVGIPATTAATISAYFIWKTYRSRKKTEGDSLARRSVAQARQAFGGKDVLRRDSKVEDD